MGNNLLCKPSAGGQLEVIVDHNKKMDPQQVSKERTDCTEMHKQNPEGIPLSP